MPAYICMDATRVVRPTSSSSVLVLAYSCLPSSKSPSMARRTASEASAYASTTTRPRPRARASWHRRIASSTGRGPSSAARQTEPRTHEISRVAPARSACTSARSSISSISAQRERSQHDSATCAQAFASPRSSFDAANTPTASCATERRSPASMSGSTNARRAESSSIARCRRSSRPAATATEAAPSSVSWASMRFPPSCSAAPRSRRTSLERAGSAFTSADARSSRATAAEMSSRASARCPAAPSLSPARSARSARWSSCGPMSVRARYACSRW